MKIPFKTAESIQDWLLYLDRPQYPELNPLDFGTGSSEDWQLGVEIIYRLLICRLIKTSPENAFGKNKDIDYSENVLHYCRVLAKINPNVAEEYCKIVEPYGLVWYYILIYASTEARELLERHGMEDKSDQNPPLNQLLIEEIEDIFQSNNVAWQSTPLIPITQN